MERLAKIRCSRAQEHLLTPPGPEVRLILVTKVEFWSKIHQIPAKSLCIWPPFPMYFACVRSEIFPPKTWKINRKEEFSRKSEPWVFSKYTNVRPDAISAVLPPLGGSAEFVTRNSAFFAPPPFGRLHYWWCRDGKHSQNTRIYMLNVSVFVYIVELLILLGPTLLPQPFFNQPST